MFTTIINVLFVISLSTYYIIKHIMYKKERGFIKYLNKIKLNEKFGLNTPDFLSEAFIYGELSVYDENYSKNYIALTNDLMLFGSQEIETEKKEEKENVNSTNNNENS